MDPFFNRKGNEKVLVCWGWAVGVDAGEKLLVFVFVFCGGNA